MVRGLAFRAEGPFEFFGFRLDARFPLRQILAERVDLVGFFFAERFPVILRLGDVAFELFDLAAQGVVRGPPGSHLLIKFFAEHAQMLFGAGEERLKLLFLSGERGFLRLARLLGLFLKRGQSRLKF